MLDIVTPRMRLQDRLKRYDTVLLRIQAKRAIVVDALMEIMCREYAEQQARQVSSWKPAAPRTRKRVA